MNKQSLILIIITLIAVTSLAALVIFPNYFIYRFMGPEGMHEHMTKVREYGIHMAGERGEYNCCIEPDCTMCYSEGNKWNYGKAGTCACDDFIARGEEPCPQCARALDCSSDEEGPEHDGSEDPEVCVIDLE
ncbi:hypothetical protein HOE31_02570 [bacterium]|jgi:hypothetical protein|nr:hypothetical protein [bacterium]MBT4121812.1 hypothetical protein [bacterium]MBT4335044.1 hypothetical protein [bacterium]MBT4495118.1 hypothetical protein [bacterium]MBT4763872.1 hypothetical protein [bacterium]